MTAQVRVRRSAAGRIVEETVRLDAVEFSTKRALGKLLASTSARPPFTWSATTPSGHEPVALEGGMMAGTVGALAIVFSGPAAKSPLRVELSSTPLPWG